MSWKKKIRFSYRVFLGLTIVILGLASGVPMHLFAEEASPHSGITITFTASAQTIARGMNTTLRWSASGGASSCNASGGWSGEQPLSGSQVVSPPKTTTYVLTCAGPGGTGAKSVTVRVEDLSSHSGIRISLIASPATITVGQSTTIMWSASGGISSCGASGGWSGEKPVSGSTTISPQQTTTYTLTCAGAGGTESKSVTVSVDEPTQSHTCSKITDSSASFSEKWGRSYNVLSPTKELLLSARCSPTQTDIAIGNDNPQMYVYSKGYTSTGVSWTPLTYTCTGESLSDTQGITWCKGKATATLAQSDSWFIAYTCQKIGTEWKCGCWDATCRMQPANDPTRTGGLWQVQGVRR